MATHAVAVCRPIAGGLRGYIAVTELGKPVVDLRREGMRTGRRSAAGAAQAMRESIQLSTLAVPPHLVQVSPLSI